MAINKIVYNNNTLIDLTSDTVTADKLIEGYTAHDKSGTLITGTAHEGGDVPVWQGTDDYVYVSDTADAPVEIYTDDGYVVLDMAPPVLNLQTKSVTPTESAQVVTADSGYDGLEEVDVGAISSSYVGSGIARKSSSDLTVSGATVTAPSGYYENSASKTVASGTEGTPTATKGTVSNNSVSVTPSVTNTAGYITGSTKTGTAVSVSASELVSGTLSITSSGTKDVTNYASASVASGTATPASTISGTSATVTTGTNTLTLSKSVSNTPTVSAGYISSGTAGNSSVSLTADVTTKAAATYTPSTSTQTISANQYLTGAQTINPIPSQYIIPSGTKSITENGTGIDVASYASVNVAVPSSSPTLITKNITANGTYDAEDDNADGYSSVTVNVSGGGGGIEYETGIYTPTSDATQLTITFSNVHTTRPFYVVIQDNSDALRETNDNLYFEIYSWYDFTGYGISATSTSTFYARVNTGYKSSSSFGTGGANINSISGYSTYLTNTAFYPYLSDTRYWRANRPYKWIAVWAPTT